MLPWLPDHDPLAPFPPTSQALGEDSGAAGLLAAGGCLSPARLDQAYRHGIFPWFGDDDPILWWSTSPRMVLATADFRYHRSLRKVVQRFMATPGCEVVMDRDTPAVIRACAGTPREGQSGTWIVPAMQRAYMRWAALGGVHGIETRIDGELVGGLYGVCIGRMFFGESMFAHRTDASKIALAALVAWCREQHIPWIDCQQQTRHLASMGAAPVPREAFEAHLQAVTPQPGPQRFVLSPRWWDTLA
ncbi:leucyl/phenylalanyl-tRNA--protein transferase [Sphaerotilus hippei]|uniref:Leucyl/phenylalanyl-tRNA--protein transferase n=1 Tax=Sphaerotilus hippei TaxID=744406 RepID=A0A318HB86_9BURK|nr:leucyl/phenylalanyl-tRNA--protein transferase [Sphaerotilus hippei]PXW97969.1 leucyl/phenylalanyl-tRNA--protein transferase [Sphaerotilus hippei]